MKKLLFAVALTAAAHAAPAAPGIDVYDRLLANGREAATALAADEQKLLEDPTDLLAQLEKQFYDAPSIESLAWFGSVAEDVAYISHQRQMSTAKAWLPAARARWRKMVAHLERGWTPGTPWPRFGAPAFRVFDPKGGNWPEQEIGDVLAKWMPRTAPSLFKSDGDAYFVGGEPLTKRQLLRGGKAGAVAYAAELSNAAEADEASRARSGAGGFRGVHTFIEFLKGQPAPAAIRFTQSGSYGIDGMLGTVAASVTAPDSLTVLAVLRDGAVKANRLLVSSNSAVCGAGQQVSIGFAAPPKTSPLAYLATLAPVDEARVKVTRLGAVDGRDPNGGSEARSYRYVGYRVDLDADGRADLVIAQGRGPAQLPTSGTYHPEDALMSIVFANIGGTWKRVAIASESGCT